MKNGYVEGIPHFQTHPLSNGHTMARFSNGHVWTPEMTQKHRPSGRKNNANGWTACLQQEKTETSPRINVDAWPLGCFFLQGGISLRVCKPIGSMLLLYMVTFTIFYHQYTPFMLAYIAAPWIRHGKGFSLVQLLLRGSSGSTRFLCRGLKNDQFRHWQKHRP